jgi:hypothetical protein
MASKDDRLQRIKSHINLTSNVDLKFTQGGQWSNMNYASSVSETSESRKQRILDHIRKTQG